MLKVDYVDLDLQVSLPLEEDLWTELIALIYVYKL